jgi:hypothetical protein
MPGTHRAGAADRVVPGPPRGTAATAGQKLSPPAVERAAGTGALPHRQPPGAVRESGGGVHTERRRPAEAPALPQRIHGAVGRHQAHLQAGHLRLPDVRVDPEQGGGVPVHPGHLDRRRDGLARVARRDGEDRRVLEHGAGRHRGSGPARTGADVDGAPCLPGVAVHRGVLAVEIGRGPQGGGAGTGVVGGGGHAEGRRPVPVPLGGRPDDVPVGDRVPGPVLHRLRQCPGAGGGGGAGKIQKGGTRVGCVWGAAGRPAVERRCSTPHPARGCPRWVRAAGRRGASPGALPFGPAPRSGGDRGRRRFPVTGPATGPPRDAPRGPGEGAGGTAVAAPPEWSRPRAEG